MFVVMLGGTIWFGPFNTYAAAEKQAAKFRSRCECGCGRWEDYLEIGTL